MIDDGQADGLAARTIGMTATVREAMERIDHSRRQIVFVVDDQERLVGAVSDGDVRRALLRGVQLSDIVSAVMNPDPLALPPDADQSDVDALMRSRGVRHIAVVDESGRLMQIVGAGERISVPLATPVVLMAGGRGLRLYPITKDIPKPLVPIGGVPMIEIILGRLRDQGFRRIHVSVNHLGHLIEDHLDDGSRLGLEVTYLHESRPLGTAGALAQLEGCIDEPFVVMNADLLTDVDLRRMLTFHRATADGATVGVREYAFEIPFGVVHRKGDLVESLAEKPEHRELVSAGIYILEPRALAMLERDDYCDMPTLLARLIESGRTVGAYQIREDWIDVGRPEDLARARQTVEGR